MPQVDEVGKRILLSDRDAFLGSGSVWKSRALVERDLFPCSSSSVRNPGFDSRDLQGSEQLESRAEFISLGPKSRSNLFGAASLLPAPISQCGSRSHLPQSITAEQHCP